MPWALADVLAAARPPVTAGWEQARVLGQILLIAPTGWLYGGWTPRHGRIVPTGRGYDNGGMSVSHHEPARPILVGVDAGATKTVALAVRLDGTQIGRATGEGANPKRHSLEVAADRIADATLRATGRRVPDLVLVAGAGIDRPEHARALEAALAGRLAGSPLPGTRILVVNDTLAVLRAGTPGGVGLVVPVSTGGNVIGRAADGRVTDRGHGIFGGGYVLGALAARAARRGVRQGMPAIGSVGPELSAAIGQAHLAWRGRRPGPEAAQLGGPVVAAAAAGDPYPERMVERWCCRVEHAVREEADRLQLGADPIVILYGGLFDASPWLASRLRQAVRHGLPGARIRALDAEPVDGAAKLALDAWAGQPVRWEFRPRR
jgi:N-acetylglucosamine kinase-like BadF-type ATPase